jgi:uncharacterized protein YuzE
MEQNIIKSTTGAIGNILSLSKLGDSKLWIDYDREADVMYVNFGKPQKADDSFQGEDGIIRRKKKDKLIGLTVLNASRFAK